MKISTTGQEWAVFRRKFFVILFLIMIIGGSFAIATYGSFWRFYYNARMTNFSVCLGLDSDGHPIPIVRPLTVTVKEINVCGYLEGNGPTIPLVFDFQHNGKLVMNPMSGYYRVGYVTARFIAPSEGFKAGNYLVLVYQGRNKLVSTEFTIEEP